MEAKGRVQVDLACRLQRKQNNERKAAVAAAEATWSVPLSNDESCKRGHISTETNPRGGLSLPLLVVLPADKLFACRTFAFMSPLIVIFPQIVQFTSISLARAPISRACKSRIEHMTSVMICSYKHRVVMIVVATRNARCSQIC